MASLRYIGEHQPKGMVVQVEDSNVKRLLDSGEYERFEFEKLVKKTQIPITKKKEVVEDDSLSE